MSVKAAFLVYDSRDLRVSAGVNLGDPLCLLKGLEVADAYALDSRFARVRLELQKSSDGKVVVSDGSEAGPHRSEVTLKGSVSLMSPEDLSTFEVAILQAGLDDEKRCYIVSPMPLWPHQDYVAVSVSYSDKGARAIMGQITSASFVAGTRLLTAERNLCPVEELNVGDELQTRDHGVQKIRWIGKQIVRGEGQLAPIRIEKGAVQNVEALCLSPMHRLFVYQRRDAIGAGRPEILVTAESLVNGVTVTKSEGGHIEYFQLLFDNHEILFAEGVAVESEIAGRMFGPAPDADDSGTSQSYEALKQAFIRSEYDRFALRHHGEQSIPVDDLIASSRGS